jgi:NTP pyrophosphatase (non-canonical NTP hydrolase)
MTRENDVINWAVERGLIVPENAKSQLLKTLEELGEVSRALLKDKQEDFIDGVGDVLVTLIILCKIKGVNLDQCLEQAWNEIKNRKGKTVDGTFIKEE